MTADRLLLAPLAAGVVAGLLAGSGNYEWAAAAVVAGVAVVVVSVDLRRRRIPTSPLLVGAGALVVAMAIAAVRGDATRAAVALLGGVVVGGVFLIVHLVDPAGVGFGDVRLATL